MPAFLNIIVESKTRRVPCEDTITIGRDSNNSIQVPDPRISRNHAIIRRLSQDQYYLFDIGSRNGSFINGLRIRTPTFLKQGDVINMGDMTLTFEQFVLPHRLNYDSAEGLADTIPVGGDNVQLVTILVADIRGYTSLSEELPIKVLSQMMSAWYDKVQKIVESHGGVVDKFIGDCVMAVWYLDKDLKRKIQGAIRSSVDIYNFTKELHSEYPDVPEPVKVGVGVNTGEAAIDIGIDGTAMGDTVNLAFRLESATKGLQCDMILSESTYCLLPRKLWQGREHQIHVKGKKESVKVCTLDLSKNKEGL